MSTEYIKQVLRAGEVAAKSVDKVVEELLDSPVEEEDSTRNRQVLIRVSEVQRERWQRAAESDGLSMSEWLRQMADFRYREIFECTHPMDQRQIYPWSEFCLKCGVRLRSSAG